MFLVSAQTYVLLTQVTQTQTTIFIFLQYFLALSLRVKLEVEIVWITKKERFLLEDDCQCCGAKTTTGKPHYPAHCCMLWMAEGQGSHWAALNSGCLGLTELWRAGPSVHCLLSDGWSSSLFRVSVPDSLLFSKTVKKWTMQVKELWPPLSVTAKTEGFKPREI